MPKDRLRVTPGTVEVVFGKLIPTSVYSLDTKGDLIAAVRGRIAAGLEVSRRPGP